MPLLALLRVPSLWFLLLLAGLGVLAWQDRQRLAAELDAARQAQAAAVATAQRQAAELDDIRRGLRAAAAERERAVARSEKLSRELREVEDARDTADDGDVAPVLRGVFDRLRRDWRVEHGLPAPERAR